MLLTAVVTSFVFTQLVPEPIRVEMRERDSFSVTASTPIAVGPGLEYHLPIITDAAKMDLRIMDSPSAKAKAIFIGVVGQFPIFEERRLRRKINSMVEPPPHGYRLMIDDDVVIIAGADKRGAIKGMHTLAQMIRGNDPLPGVEILDGPAEFDRVIRFAGKPPMSLIGEAAALKADFLMVDSTGFWTDAGRADLEPILTRAQILGLGIVPHLRPFEDVGNLLEQQPTLAQTRANRTSLVLRGEEMVPLPIREITGGKGLSPRVTVSGVAMIPREDYALDQEAPGFAWTIRRLVGSAIPDGATVTIEFQAKAPDAHGLSIAAPNAGQVFAEVARAVTDTINPQAIHVGPGDLNIVALDGRARATGKSLTDMLGEFFVPLLAWKEAPTLIIDEGAHALLPKNMQRKFKTIGEHNVDWRSSEMSIAKSFSAIRALDASAIVLNASAWTDRDRDTVRSILDKAWSPTSPVALWPDHFNRFMPGSELEFPTAEESRGALISFMNTSTLGGAKSSSGSPLNESNFSPSALGVSEENFDLTYALRFSDALSAYLDLEARYARNPSASVLRQLSSYVEDYSQVNPDWPEERTDRIIEVIKGQQLIVPSTILFGEYVYPYREHPNQLVAYSGEPEYTYEETGARAHFDFGVPLHVERIDFEAAGLTSIEWIADGNVVAQDNSAPIMAPLLAPNAKPVTTLEIVATGASERAALRNVRASIRSSAMAIATPTRASQSPRIDGRFDDACWDVEPAITGFQRKEGGVAAAAIQTQVRIVQRNGNLYLAIDCHEPRMATMVALTGPRDSVLWPRESVVIDFETAADEGITLATNPNGIVYDSRNGDPLWDGEARIATRRASNAWTIEIAMPMNAKYERITFTRYRFNARREVSTGSAILKN